MKSNTIALIWVVMSNVNGSSAILQHKNRAVSYNISTQSAKADSALLQRASAVLKAIVAADEIALLRSIPAGGLRLGSWQSQLISHTKLAQQFRSRSNAYCLIMDSRCGGKGKSNRNVCSLREMIKQRSLTLDELAMNITHLDHPGKLQAILHIPSSCASKKVIIPLVFEKQLDGQWMLVAIPSSTENTL
jgi:hypothetical protein